MAQIPVRVCHIACYDKWYFSNVLCVQKIHHYSTVTIVCQQCLFLLLVSVYH